jgi:hypothetical protein
VATIRRQSQSHHDMTGKDTRRHAPQERERRIA